MRFQTISCMPWFKKSETGAQKSVTVDKITQVDLGDSRT